MQVWIILASLAIPALMNLPRRPLSKKQLFNRALCAATHANTQKKLAKAWRLIDAYQSAYGVIDDVGCSILWQLYNNASSELLLRHIAKVV